MNRTKRASLAKETLRIVEEGGYVLADSRRIDIRQPIDDSLAATELVRPDEFEALAIPESINESTVFDVRNETTLSAAVRLVVEKAQDGVLCLNFASAKNPGGGFLGGSQAQEESLARSSSLVKSLESKWDYYEVHRGCGTSIYSDHMILSPNVPVFRADDGSLLDQPYLLSIVTSPAVNAGAVIKNEPERIGQIEPVMITRISRLLRLATARGFQHLILGAWGCGVFRNEPAMIARLFSEALRDGGTYEKKFESVTFAVLDSTENETIIGPFRAQFQQGNDSVNAEQLKRTSKKMSYILRHQPDSAGITLAPGGWVAVDDLIAALKISRDHLDEVVFTNDKQRFEYSEDATKIRARQGHSTKVDLQYEAATPPDLLFHGTATRFLESIRENGISRGKRHHVHLSVDRDTMIAVGTRHGKPVVLEIDAKQMLMDGHQFFVTGNHVWLTEHVAPQYLRELP